jgi:hypothetical protein
MRLGFFRHRRGSSGKLISSATEGDVSDLGLQVKASAASKTDAEKDRAFRSLSVDEERGDAALYGLNESGI